MLAIGWLVSASPVSAQWRDQGFVSSNSRRLVHQFDFEEARFNNFEDLPMYWYAMGRPALTSDRQFLKYSHHKHLVSRPDFPAYTIVGFDRPQSEEGNHRLHLGLNGGSAGAFVEVGAVPAVPLSDYVVTAMVTTSSLKHARARVLAYFIDSGGRRIEDSVSVSELIQTDGREQSVAVKLRGDFPTAAWMGIQVELLQPAQLGHAAKDHDVSYIEVDGDAWFDDVGVWQLPHVQVGTQSRINIIRSPHRPRLNMQLKDLTARPLAIDTTVYDYHMHPVAKTQRRATEWSPVNWRWQPTIDRYGWYLVDMVVTDVSGGNSLMVARTLAAFLWLPEEPDMHMDDMHRFRIFAEGASPEELEMLIEVLDGSRLASLVISAWDPLEDIEGVDDRQKHLTDLIQDIASQGRDLIMSLHPIPQQLAQFEGVDADNPITLFTKEPDVWAPFLRPVTMRHGQRIRNWQLGTSEYPYAFYMPELPQLVETMIQNFRAMTPRPKLVLPWRIDQSRRQDVPSGPAYAIHVPSSVWPEHMDGYMDQWRDSPKVEYWLHLHEPPADKMRHDRRVEDLALRMLYAWKIQPSGLSISKPWTVSTDRRIALLPDSLLGTFSGVAHRLAGRRVIGQLPLGPGLESFIFDGPSGGMLAAWNQSSSPQKATIEMFLGSNPQAVDVWGNRTNVPLVNGVHQWSLSKMPVFIEGIDPELAAFRASFKIRPPFIESTVAQHRHVIEFTNPWPQTISGHMNITDPESWDIQPSRHHFSVASGSTARVPVRLSFPVTETAGVKRLVAHFDFVAGQRYQVDVAAPMELGLTYVGFDATLALVDNPTTGTRDAIVTQMITNKSAKSISLYCFSNLVGYPRQERIIPKLDPGQLVVRRFIFKNAADILKKRHVRVGVRESVGPAVFNMILSGTGRSSE